MLTPKPSVPDDEGDFRRLVSAGFAQKRKTLLNNLKNLFPGSAAALERAEIDGRRRAETLTLQEWESLSFILTKEKTGQR